MDIPQVGYKLKLFLEKYKDVLLEEHLEELEHHLQFLLQFKTSTQIKTKNYDFHWSICPYTSSDVESLPETCPCITAENKMLRIVKLIKLYEKIYLK